MYNKIISIDLRAVLSIRKSGLKDIKHPYLIKSLESENKFWKMHS